MHHRTWKVGRETPNLFIEFWLLGCDGCMRILRIAVRELCKFYELISKPEMFLSAADVASLQKSVLKCLLAYQWLPCDDCALTNSTKHNYTCDVVMTLPDRPDLSDPCVPSSAFERAQGSDKIRSI